MSTFYDTVVRNSKYFGSDVVCKDMAMLEPGTRAAVLAMVADAKAEGIDLRVLETYRSQTRQSALFMKRATQLRVVGCHGYGIAADFGVFIDGKYQESNKPYIFLDALARKHGLVSGQTWGHPYPNRGFVDSGHVQRIPVARQNAMFGGSWYPPAVYDPYQDMSSPTVATGSSATKPAIVKKTAPARPSSPSKPSVVAHAETPFNWLEHLFKS